VAKKSTKICSSMLGSKETDKMLQNPLWNEKMRGFPKKPHHKPGHGSFVTF
jgi:hypothetical protein